MTKEQIKHMVDRFLGWRLPEHFNPDCGISFKKTFNDHLPTPLKNEPTGTNLFDAVQATEMVRYMLEGLPGDNAPKLDIPRDWCIEAAKREGDSEVGAGALARDPIVDG